MDWGFLGIFNNFNETQNVLMHTVAPIARMFGYRRFIKNIQILRNRNWIIMATNEMRSYSLAEMEDKHIGKKELKNETNTNMSFVWNSLDEW